jgi:hypothetical protein
MAGEFEMTDKDTVHDCLNGIAFPVNPWEIGVRAMANGQHCSSELVDDLRQLPLQLYQSDQEIAAKAGGPPESP